jgi:hypothetical protein
VLPAGIGKVDMLKAIMPAPTPTFTALSVFYTNYLKALNGYGSKYE